jgi:hypothetical protein
LSAVGSWQPTADCGNFDRQLNLGSATPGIYTLSVAQGDKVFTEKIVLLPKA